MRVQAEDHAVAVADGAAEPFDLVGVDVRRRHLDGARKIDDHLTVSRRLTDIHHSLADLNSKIELCPAEALRRILIDDFGVRYAGGEVADQPRSTHRDVDNSWLVEAENDPALQFRRRIVEMNDGAAGPADRFECFFD